MMMLSELLVRLQEIAQDAAPDDMPVRTAWSVPGGLGEPPYSLDLDVTVAEVNGVVSTIIR